jgi:hypothetical protein
MEVIAKNNTENPKEGYFMASVFFLSNLQFYFVIPILLFSQALIHQLFPSELWSFFTYSFYTSRSLAKSILCSRKECELHGDFMESFSDSLSFC